MMKTLEQQRAAFAWKSVQGCKSDYVNLAKGAPALLSSSGLMQLLAFYAHKDEKHHAALKQHLLGWLYKRELLPSEDFSRAMTYLCDEADADKFRRATAEAHALLKWLRHFAPAVCGDN